MIKQNIYNIWLILVVSIIITGSIGLYAYTQKLTLEIDNKVDNKEIEGQISANTPDDFSEVVLNNSDESEDIEKEIENPVIIYPPKYFSKMTLNNCGKLEDYEDDYWYKDFIEKIKELNYYSEFDVIKILERNPHINKTVDEFISDSGKNTPEQVKQVCYLDKNYLLAVVPGEYGGAGFKLIRYNIELKIIEIAKREDIDGGKNTPWYLHLKTASNQTKEIYYWFGPPDEIIGKEEGIVNLIGKMGDAGCSSTSYYNYNLEKNYINIIKSCSICMDEDKETCVEY